MGAGGQGNQIGDKEKRDGDTGMGTRMGQRWGQGWGGQRDRGTKQGTGRAEKGGRDERHGDVVSSFLHPLGARERGHRWHPWVQDMGTPTPAGAAGHISCA